ncbi:MAG: bifunctional oligoribonuclease/PAP phosphatase NrnA [Halobacteria archaeon]
MAQAHPHPPLDRLEELLSKGGDLAVVCHDNPDPDCIASALALKAIAESFGVEEVSILYSGEVSHQQNRAFVNLMDVDMRTYDDIDLNTFDLVAFVDHSIKGANNEVGEDVDIDFVIDHHQSENGIDAEYVDVREEYGATTTMLVQYMTALGVVPDEELATGLLFAIRRETLDFIRGLTEHEFDAAKYLFELADIDLLNEMIKPAFTPQTLDTIGEAILNRDVRASALVSGVGRTSERDALPQAADYLMNLEGIATVLVFGIVNEEIQISARSNDSRINLDSVVRDAFGDVGSAGGHRDMAGAQISLGIFSDMTETEDKLIGLTSEIICERFFEAMNLAEDEEENGE